MTRDQWREQLFTEIHAIRFELADLLYHDPSREVPQKHIDQQWAAIASTYRLVERCESEAKSMLEVVRV